MESSCDAVLVVDAATGTVVDCNASACRLLDTTSGQLIGAHHTTFYPQELRAEYAWDFEQVASGATASTVERQLLLRNGETVWVEASGCVSEAEGRRLVLGILRDIRGQRSARDELRRLNKILLATSACDEAIMQAADQTQLHGLALLEAICRLAALCVFIRAPLDRGSSSVDVLRGATAFWGRRWTGPGPGSPWHCLPVWCGIPGTLCLPGPPGPAFTERNPGVWCRCPSNAPVGNEAPCSW